LNPLFRFLVGSPIPNDRAGEQRLPKFLALPVFSSDALSSVAYGTQEILLQLSLAGAVGLQFTLPISGAILLVLVFVTLSYRQTIQAYPSGGGSYIVSKENLSVGAGLLAASALLTDYVLTVSVSIAAGVQQITSLFPHLRSHTEVICLIAIAIITLANLRGMKESGLLFALPTYAFIMLMLLLVGSGLVGILFGSPISPPHPPRDCPVVRRK
jgi:amino acid transporter